MSLAVPQKHTCEVARVFMDRRRTVFSNFSCHLLFSDGHLLLAIDDGRMPPSQPLPQQNDTKIALNI